MLVYLHELHYCSTSKTPAKLSFCKIHWKSHINKCVRCDLQNLTEKFSSSSSISTKKMKKQQLSRVHLENKLTKWRRHPYMSTDNQKLFYRICHNKYKHRGANTVSHGNGKQITSQCSLVNIPLSNNTPRLIWVTESALITYQRNRANKYIHYQQCQLPPRRHTNVEWRVCIMN